MEQRRIAWVLCSSMWLLASAACAQDVPANGIHLVAPTAATGLVSPAPALKVLEDGGTVVKPVAASGYHEPLRAPLASGVDPFASRSMSSVATGVASPLPVFQSDGSSRLEQASRGAFEFAAKLALSMAAEKTGATRPVPPPANLPYRSNSPTPEPAAVATTCQESDASRVPVACIGH